MWLEIGKTKTRNQRIMSPFSRLLYDLRMHHGIRQAELAELVGYEQSYISALESSLKGPPTGEFVERLIRALSLSQEAQDELRKAAEASQRKLDIDAGAPTDIFWLLRDLRAEIGNLSPGQVRILRDIININGIRSEQRPVVVRRLKRRTKEEAEM